MNIKFVLVAAATAAATILPAQTTVPVMANTNLTISGMLGIGFKSSNWTPASGDSFSDTYLGDNTSRLTIMATSKITDGWNVMVRLGSRFEANYGPGTSILPAFPYVPIQSLGNTTLNKGGSTGSFYGSLGEDDTWGGISSPYGTVTFGKSTIWITDSVDMAYLGIPSCGESYRIWDANGLAVFNILDTAMTTAGAANTLNITRSQGVFQYISPRFSDMSIQVAWSKNPYNSALQNGDETNGKNYENGDTWYGKFSYNHGPINAFLSVLDIKAQGGPGGPTANFGPGFNLTFPLPPLGTPSVEAYRAGVSYRVAGFKAGVVFDHTANVLAVDAPAQSRDAYMIPLSYTWDKHGVYLTYSNAGNYSIGGQSQSNTSATQYNVVYDYALTSRAFVGLFYTHLKNDAAANYNPFLSGTNLGPSGSPGAGSTWSQLGLNFQYWF